MPLFTRREYREEYLKHDQHWQQLRAEVMTPGVLCQKCRRAPATEPHHLRYGKIYDVTAEDLMPVCRPCHCLIEKAKRLRCIRKEHTLRDVLALSEDKIKEMLRGRREKIELPLGFLEAACRAPLMKQRAICGVMKALPPASFMEWVGVMVSRTVWNKLVWTLHKFQYRTKPRAAKAKYGRKIRVHY